MKGTTFYQVKGGAGASTIAAAFALEHAARGERFGVELHANDLGDTSAILGEPNPQDGRTQITANLRLVGLPYDELYRYYAAGWPDIVCDVGQAWRDDDTLLPRSRRFLVIRNCYLHLRAADDAPTPDLVIVVVEPNRALTVADAEDAIGVRAVSMPIDPAVSRAVDAGLLPHRRPPHLRNLVQELDGEFAFAHV